MLRVSLGLVLVLFCQLLCASSTLPWYDTWPKPSARASDPQMDAFVEARLAAMSTEEKVAQMLMLEHNALSADEAKEYKMGGMLHGAGQAIFLGNSPVSWECRSSRYLSLACWGELADAYWAAVSSASWHQGAEPIPVLWGTDAMHGAGAVHGATLFPHNIGIGAALIGDPTSELLIQRMYQATREQVALQGFRQIFSPAVSVGRNTHWGRSYEAYSENPLVHFEATPLAVTGIQSPWDGDPSQRLASTLKHYIGDGGTVTGTGQLTSDSGFDPTDTVFKMPRTDRGLNTYSENLLLNLHAAGYLAGIDAGAMSVMVSLSAWENGKLHGDRYLIQEVLKDRLQFDGIVVTDWDGIESVEGCSIRDCVKAINAGIDMFMISYLTRNGWKDFYHNTLRHIARGDIAMSRIDDAVRRILRVKYKLGFFSNSKPAMPSQSYLAFGYSTVDEAQNGLNQWSDLAKTLAQKSMVLMKNEGALLPVQTLSEATPLLVAGAALDSPQMQQGGWGLHWQGFRRFDFDHFYNKEDYPQSVTVLDALKLRGIPFCEYESTCEGQPKVALVVMAEHPYAEWYGDIHAGGVPGGHQNIAYASIRTAYADDERLVRDLKAQGYQVITVFFSGRPLVVDALNQSDVFIAGFLPGSQGGPALVDLLFGFNGAEFAGRLPFAWPLSVSNTSTFHGKPDHFPGTDAQWQALVKEEVMVGPAYAYPFGYGL